MSKVYRHPPAGKIRTFAQIFFSTDCPEMLENSTTSWYSSWFDSPYYHLLYKNRDESEARHFLDRLLKVLQLPKGARVQDLACGKGRHAVHLNACGYRVTGLDLSEENILHCLRSSSETMDFYRHDMRQVFRYNYYDAIFNLFTSFGYFEKPQENLKVLHAAASGLKKGGFFILDYLNPAYTLSHLKADEKVTAGDIVFHIRRWQENKRLIKEISFSDAEQQCCYREKVDLIGPEEFHEYFRQTGLEIQTIFGDYQLSPFNTDTSPRIIIVTQKP
jgi:SAM-dependent methyltransferase